MDRKILLSGKIGKTLVQRKTKRLAAFIIAMIALCLLEGCGEQAQIDRLNQEILDLQGKKRELESEISMLDGKAIEVKEEKGSAKYILTLEIKQSHFTLDISEHLKDSMNAIEIQIPVDKEYYDSVEAGQNIADEFRMGSLIFKGTFGKFKVTVVKKEIK